MLFHELRVRFGDDIFFKALLGFIQGNIYRRASWHDLQRAFESTTGTKLYTFFNQRLNRKDIPRFSVDRADIVVENGELNLKFDLIQSEVPYTLRIPLTITSPGTKRQMEIEVKQAREKIKVPLDEPPSEVMIDDRYDFMRRLTQAEIPPVLASILGSEKLTVVAPAHCRVVYKPFVHALGVRRLIDKEPDALTLSDIKAGSLLIAGFDNPVVEMLFGKQAIPEDDVRLRVYKNPYNTAERILLVHIRNRKAAQAVSRKIRHYGKYTELAFLNGKNTEKSVAGAINGIPVIRRPATRVVDPDHVTTLHDIFPELMNRRVIFVGEKHDRFSHHVNQLWVIQKLHEAGAELGIGMEMFPKTSQKSLDAYLAGHIDEKTFLKESHYFENWGYDYNLYKPIIDYAKKNHISIIALNIEGDISRKVARQGIDHLSAQERKQLPAFLDLSDDQYRQDLQEVFALHDQQDDLQDFNLFYQAQTLWDETMAETAQYFLERFPYHKLVVLAGNGHIRKKYGIPERLHRRVGEAYTAILQDETIQTGIADYILQTQRIKGKKSPRLGIAITEEDRALQVRGVMENSPAQKAGFKKGDCIDKIGDQPINSRADLKRALFYRNAGDRVSIRINRNGNTLDLEVELSANHPL